MKVIMYMATTANGIIAAPDNSTSFISKENWKSFDALSTEFGNCVMGRNTYNVEAASGRFPFKDRLNVVMTHHFPGFAKSENVIFTNSSPHEVLNLMHERGFYTVFLCGGSKLNTSFLKEKLVDEIYLDIEPIFMGQGIPFLDSSELSVSLELIEAKKLSKNTVQFHYSVVK